MLGFTVLLAVALMIRLAPDSPQGRFLNAALVEQPLARLAEMNRRQIVHLLVLAGLTLFASDMLLMFGSFDVLSLYAWDLTLYLDTMFVAYALAAVALGRSACRWLATRASLAIRRRTRSRARRTRAAAERPGRPDNDDDPAEPWALAA